MINNAGILHVDEIKLGKTIRETFETHAFAPALVTYVFVPLLKMSSQPRIVHVSSDNGAIIERLDEGFRTTSCRGPPTARARPLWTS